ncbi:MAG TPA: ChbG/HpnK family deacetylase [Candidatus Acidoferrum sp.]|nr:ChbG/HpnK family deacetylase [Candidatus Acidoferrum sp.]
MLILNADDWGRDRNTTDRMLECLLQRSVSSVSAMVFMADTERSAQLAREHAVDAGLHLNLTLPFSDSACPSNLKERQRKLVAFLTLHPLARVIFHPGLKNTFEYVVKSQLDEFCRLYGRSPERVDGHHHVHLCANVLFGGLLPQGTTVRRNFSFLQGEKSLANRLYRKAMDSKLARRHVMVDFLFPLAPLEPRSRLERIRSLAEQHVVEVETHPINEDEYNFLTGEEVGRWTRGMPIAARYWTAGDDRNFTQGART